MRSTFRFNDFALEKDEPERMPILSPRFPPAPGGRIVPHDTVIDFVPSKGAVLRGKNLAAFDYCSDGFRFRSYRMRHTFKGVVW
jgi:hypothetical protein